MPNPFRLSVTARRVKLVPRALQSVQFPLDEETDGRLGYQVLKNLPSTCTVIAKDGATCRWHNDRLASEMGLSVGSTYDGERVRADALKFLPDDRLG